MGAKTIWMKNEGGEEQGARKGWVFHISWEKLLPSQCCLEYIKHCRLPERLLGWYQMGIRQETGNHTRPVQERCFGLTG